MSVEKDFDENLLRKQVVWMVVDCVLGKRAGASEVGNVVDTLVGE